jgi:Domain of unknown function (DUF4268)
MKAMQVQKEEVETLEASGGPKVRVEPDILCLHFVRELYAREQSLRVPQIARTPDKRGILYGRIGRTGFSFNYVTLLDKTRVELLIQTKDAKEQLHKIKQNKEAIEARFGDALDWPEKVAIRQCRVVRWVAGGYRSPRSEWPRIHDNLIDAMTRLEAALATYVSDAPAVSGR